MIIGEYSPRRILDPSAYAASSQKSSGERSGVEIAQSLGRSKALVTRMSATLGSRGFFFLWRDLYERRSRDIEPQSRRGEEKHSLITPVENLTSLICVYEHGR